jgi:acetylornithine deacetylase
MSAPPAPIDPLPILQDLVAIPSVNPMGRDVSGSIYYEGGVSDYLVGFFEQLGVEHRRIELAPGRSNVLAVLRGTPENNTILLDAHQDTVPVDGMTIDPFAPKLDGDRLYGRGACDVKGGLAAMLAAFARMKEIWSDTKDATVIMSCSCDEEATSLGVNALVKSWAGPADEATWWRRKPNMAIVAEPTELNVVVAHRGASRWKIRTSGRACHSSDPSQGVNAIYKMGHVLAALEEYAALLPGKVEPHPLCGPATLSVGRIEGGVSVNTVPDACTIDIDRRVIPGEDGWAAIRDVEGFLREQTKVNFEMLPPWLVGQALSDDQNGWVADILLKKIARVVEPKQKIGVPFGTHASRFAAAGVQSVVFGPGSIAQAHTKDEWISVTQLRQAAEIYLHFCASFA